MNLEKQYRDIQAILSSAAMESRGEYIELLEEVITDCEGRLEGFATDNDNDT